MRTNTVMPLGIIEDSTENSGTMVFTRPSDPGTTLPGTPIVIKNEDPRFQATALMRGHITEVSTVTASFVIEKSEISPNWPKHLDPKGTGNPVYQAIPGTFHPDFTRASASEDEFKLLLDLAQQHEQDTGIVPRGTAYIFYMEWDPDDQDADLHIDGGNGEEFRFHRNPGFDTPAE